MKGKTKCTKRNSASQESYSDYPYWSPQTTLIILVPCYYLQKIVYGDNCKMSGAFTYLMMKIRPLITTDRDREETTRTLIV